jgi:signal transduction histidine kinase
MRNTIIRWLRGRTVVPKEPLWSPPLTALNAFFALILTLFFEQGDLERARAAYGLSGPAPETVLAAGFVFILWLAEAAGVRWPRPFFIAMVVVPVTWLMLMGRVIYAPYFLIMVVARIPWVGTHGETLVALVLTLVSAYLPSLRLGERYDHWMVIALAISVTVFMSYLFNVARRSRDELEAAQDELARQSIAAERRQIAREVHDVIAHSMAIMMLHLTGARHILQRDPQRAAEALAQAEQFGRQSLDDLRRTVSLLRDDQNGTGILPPLPGADQIGSLVDRYKNAGLEIQLTVNGDAAALSAAAGLDLYRITQEALTNVVKHAPGAQVQVCLDIGHDRTCLKISDSGKSGANAPFAAQASPSGLGIASMRERAARLGGHLSAGPSGSGWQVECVIPSNGIEEPPAH